MVMLIVFGADVRRYVSTARGIFCFEAELGDGDQRNAAGVLPARASGLHSFQRFAALIYLAWARGRGSLDPMHCAAQPVT